MSPLEDELIQVLRERWLRKEIAQRHLNRALDQETAVFAFQIVFFADGRTETRINDEVEGTLRVRASDHHPGHAPGEIVDVERDFEEILQWQLDSTSGEEGFATVFFHRGEWRLFFNAMHNVKAGRRHLTAARQFMETAETAAKSGKLLAATDTLYSASELANKAFLFTFPTTQGTLNTHGRIARDYSRLSRFHAFDTEYTPFVKRLQNARPAARYLKRQLELNEEDLEGILEVVRRFLDWIAEEFVEIERHRRPRDAKEP